MESLIRLALALLASSARGGVVASVFLSSGPIFAAEPSDAKKDAKKIDQWSAPEVLAEAERLKDQAVDAERHKALAQRAATLVLAADFQKTGEYATLQRLIETAAPAFDSLSEKQQAQLENLLAALAATEDAATFEQLQARVALLNGLGKHDVAAVGAIETWLGSRDLSLLEIDQVAWCLVESLPNRSGLKEFKVVWEGALTPPRAGQYEFSTTPINVNRVGPDFIRHSIAVTVGDVEAIRTPQEADAASDAAADEEWQPAGTAIDLPAQEAVPVRVEMHYQCAQPCVFSSPSALLCWKGPGLERQAISSDALVGPDGQSEGLHAEYHWKETDQAKSMAEDSVVVDGFWSTPARLAPQNPMLVKQLSDRLRQLAADEEYLQQCETGKLTHVYLQSPSVVGVLTSAQRREFLATVMERPELLKSVDADQLLRLYRCFRFGAEQESVDLLGQWAEAHRNSSCILPQSPTLTGFFADNYFSFERIGRCLALQHSEGLQLLQVSWLEDEDGRCRLPVAKMLGFGFAARGELREWIALLDQKLADEAVAGDGRVDWLLARAHAEELVQSGGELIARGKLRLSVGRPWLDEAELVAESDAVRQRVVAEQISRLAASEHWAAAREKLAHAGQDAAGWGAAIAKLEATSRLEPDLQRLRSERLRLADLKRRHQKAVARGDSVNAERIAARVEAIEVTLNSHDSR